VVFFRYTSILRMILELIIPDVYFITTGKYSSRTEIIHGISKITSKYLYSIQIILSLPVCSYASSYNEYQVCIGVTISFCLNCVLKYHIMYEICVMHP
jgi:hypothetical protein